MDEKNKGKMTVTEAGRKGGKKGGATTRKKYGREFYQKIGRAGGKRVRELIEAGKKARKGK